MDTCIVDIGEIWKCDLFSGGRPGRWLLAFPEKMQILVAIVLVLIKKYKKMS